MKNTQYTEMPLATEVMHEMKVTATRWKVAFTVMVVLEVLTVVTGYMLIK